MQDFRKLDVWRKGHGLALSIYRATTPFPADERFGLTSQMRRAAFSVPANIAEGCGRAGNVELRQFLHMALGSASELDYFCLLAHDLNLLAPKQYEVIAARIREVKLMLGGLISKVGVGIRASKSYRTDIDRDTARPTPV
ncbi:MAG: four helix bundle protein [Acidobacteria bacterium]|nr:four helix bundle protein [Acidobacteriota bacterium]MBS1867761.1 four helix bundle protein [Acidobacteriota bacterium]